MKTSNVRHFEGKCRFNWTTYALQRKISNFEPISEPHIDENAQRGRLPAHKAKRSLSMLLTQRSVAEHFQRDNSHQLLHKIFRLKFSFL